MNYSFLKRHASSSALFRKNSEGTLATVSTSCSGSLQETSKSLKGREAIIGYASEATRVLFRIDANIIEVYAVKQRKDAYE
jgi:hypothetical protein